MYTFLPFAIESVVIVARFNEPKNPTMRAILQRNIDMLKMTLKSENIVRHVTDDSFELLRYTAEEIFPNLRHASSKVLITITDEAYAR